LERRKKKKFNAIREQGKPMGFKNIAFKYIFVISKSFDKTYHKCSPIDSEENNSVVSL
jgi:hypothetical protein